MIEKEVHEYLKSGIEKGFSLKELKRELIKAGHEIKVVEEAAKEFERKNAFKIISVFGIVIVVSLVVIFGFKGLIFKERNVVGVNLENNNVNNQIGSCSNGAIKDCSFNEITGFQVCQNNEFSECIKNNFDSCPLNGKSNVLCCVRNSKLIDCGNEQYFSKNEFVFFRANVKELIKDKINEKFYKECTYSYIRGKKEDKVEKKEYCAVNLESDKDFFITLYGFTPLTDENNFVNIRVLDVYSELDKNNTVKENKKKSFELFNLKVNAK